MDPDRDLSDLEQSATAARPRYDDEPRSTTFVLTVVEGTSAGKSFTIDAAAPPRLLLGQGPACELRLEDRQVSRRHAALERDGQGVPRVVRRIEREGSGILTSLQEADGLIEIPESRTAVEAGEMVWFVPFSELGLEPG